MIPLALVLAGATSAAGVLATVGAEALTNDPFLHTRGVTSSIEVEPNPLVRLGLSGAWYPSLDATADWKPLTTQLVETNHIAPDLSRVIARVQVAVRVQPLRIGLGHLAACTGFGVGGGFALTRDDVVDEYDPYTPATIDQRHPTVTWGLSSEVGGRWVRGRVRLDRVTFLETVGGTNVEMKGQVFAALDLVVRLGGTP
jgi:hypothetical protein